MGERVGETSLLAKVANGRNEESASAVYAGSPSGFLDQGQSLVHQVGRTMSGDRAEGACAVVILGDVDYLVNEPFLETLVPAWKGSGLENRRYGMESRAIGLPLFHDRFSKLVNVFILFLFFLFVG
jgi:hypothetical protein